MCILIISINDLLSLARHILYLQTINIQTENCSSYIINYTYFYKTFIHTTSYYEHCVESNH